MFINLLFSSLKLKNGWKKHVQSVARIKYGFVKLVQFYPFDACNTTLHASIRTTSLMRVKNKTCHLCL